MKDQTLPRPHTQSARRAAVKSLKEDTTTERRADTQRRLLEAGRRVLVEYGVGGTSVGMVTKEAGFSRGAFYSNFTDMDHFVTRLAQQEWDQVLTTIGSTLREALPPLPAQDSQLSNAQSIADGLLESTEPLFSAAGTTSQVGPNADPDANNYADAEGNYLERLEALAHALLQAIPRDREFHLLWASLTNFLVRDPENSPQLKSAFVSFREGMAQYVVSALDNLGLESRVTPLDFVDVMIGLGTRSSQAKLAHPTSVQDFELLDRVLPKLLSGLVRPQVVEQS